MQPTKPIRNIDEFIQKVNNKVRSLQHSRCSSIRDKLDERRLSPSKGLSPRKRLSPKRKTKSPNKKASKSSLNPHIEPDMDSTCLNFVLNNNNPPKTKRRINPKLQQATKAINRYKSELQKAFTKIAELESILNSNDSNKTFYTSYFKDKKT